MIRCEAISIIARRWCARPTGTGISPRCSRRRSSATRLSRSMPSTLEIARVRDLAREPMPGEIRLQWWREVLAGERDGEAAAHPVAAALRKTLDRYGSWPIAARVDRCAHLRPLRRTDGSVTISNSTPPDAIAGASPWPPEFSARQRRRVPTVHAGRERRHYDCRFSSALRGTRRAAALCAAGRAGAPRVKPRRDFRVNRRWPACCARRHAQARAPASRGGASSTCIDAAGILPALLPVAWSGRAAAHGARRLQPFSPSRSPWRRQWLLWRAARNPDRISAADYSAASAVVSPAIQRSRSASARALSALLRARFFAEPRPNLRPSRS